MFSIYSRTGLRTAPSVAHLDSLGIAPLGLFSAQYENKLKTLYFLFSALCEFQPFPPKGKGAEGFVVRILFFLLYGLNFPIDTHIIPCYPIMVHNNNDTLLFQLRVLSLG